MISSAMDDLQRKIHQVSRVEMLYKRRFSAHYLYFSAIDAKRVRIEFLVFEKIVFKAVKNLDGENQVSGYIITSSMQRQRFLQTKTASRSCALYQNIHTSQKDTTLKTLNFPLICNFLIYFVNAFIFLIKI